MSIDDLIKEFICDYDDTTPHLLPTDKCFEECCKGEWCKKALPKFKQDLLATLLTGLGKKKLKEDYHPSDPENEYYEGYNQRATEDEERLREMMR